MIAAYILLGILLVILYGVLCFGTYMILCEFYNENDEFRWWVEDHISTRTRNILLRIFVAFGPISFIPFILIILACILAPLFKNIFEWFSDIDSTEL